MSAQGNHHSILGTAKIISALPTALTATLVLTAAGPAAAQPGWVLSHQKISNTQGGFIGTLNSVPTGNSTDPVDVIDVFRRAEFVNELVDAAVQSGAKLFWMQQGIRNARSAGLLREAGLEVVEDRCLMVEHMRLLGRV